MSTIRFARRRRWAAGIVAILVLGSSGCDESAPAAELSAPRESDAPAATLQRETSVAERMGVRAPSAGAESGAPTQASSSAQGFTWSTPEGWSELPSTAMRVVNFRVAGEAQAECYLTLLGGDGGGLAANVNRWRTQMGAPALSGDEVAKLPTHTLLGGEATLVDVRGAFRGMGGETIADARLVGLVRITPQGAAFLKMTGPASVLESQLEAFLALAASLRG